MGLQVTWRAPAGSCPNRQTVRLVSVLHEGRRRANQPLDRSSTAAPNGGPKGIHKGGSVFKGIVCGAKTPVVGLVVALAILTGAHQARAQHITTEQPDKYTWLEDIHGERPMAWVKEENDRSQAVLEKNPHFATLQAEALKGLDSPGRIAFPEFSAGYIYNTWQDAEHVRGI